MTANTIERLTTALSGRYRIERELGAGGMATVYLAEDLKHDRKVAIKVLKPELAAVLGAERFVVEIKTTASMSHPHILPLFDSGTVDGFLFYVMPYIQGETIREKLNRETQFGVDEAVRIAREVADALDYAHRHGVIHRDIKPENLLLHDGRAMVMDFGIAIAVSAAAGGRMTETGLSLGTPHYMSPEQATAEKEITARSDVYSLASVLYEMLAGEPPHGGGSAQQIIMKIITEQAQPVTTRRKSVPANVDAALAKALEKLPADRFGSAKAFADALADDRFTTSVNAPRSATSGRVRGVPVGILVAAVAVIAAGTGWMVRGSGARSDSRAPITFATALGQAGVDQAFISISPDGRRIAQSVVDSLGALHLAVRDLATNTVTILDGTEGAWDSAEFSADGEWVYFVAESRLKRVPSRGGPATTLVDSLRLESNGVAIAEHGDVYFPVRQSGRWIVLTVDQGKKDLWLFDVGRKILSQLTRAPAYAFKPVWMPDSRHVIYSFEDGPYQVHSIPIDGSAPDRVAATSPYDKYPMSVSPDGRRLLMTESVSGDRMSVVSLDSAVAPVAVTDSRLEQRGAVFSPDGKWIAFAEHSSDFKAEIYIRLASGAGGQRVVSAGGGFQPRWTRGGREIAYIGPTGMMSAPVDLATGTAGTPIRLFSLAEARRLTRIEEKTALVHEGLRALVARESARRLASLGGTDPAAAAAARRRSRPKGSTRRP